MQPRSPKYLFDIRDCAGFILSVTNGRTIDQFVNDRMARDAVERNFITIGEAISQLKRVEPSLAERIDPQGLIVGFRNILVHGYHSLDYRKVWAVIESGLPDLVRLIDGLLEECPPA